MRLFSFAKNSTSLTHPLKDSESQNDIKDADGAGCGCLMGIAILIGMFVACWLESC